MLEPGEQYYHGVRRLLPVISEVAPPHMIQWAANEIRKAAELGEPRARLIVERAGADCSEDRLYVEIQVHFWEGGPKKDLFEPSVGLSAAEEGASHKNELNLGEEVPWADVVRVTSDEFLLQGSPEGTEVPPQSSRSAHKAPDLHRANRSFAASLVMHIRDRFGGDAPSVYRAAHVSRKTYSAIVGNELRPVSKRTAVAFAFALHLAPVEADAFLRTAGFALSNAILEDMIFCACLSAAVYDIDRVNVILQAHGVPPFPSEGV